MSQPNQSELIVITKAKELCAYVMTVTQKSPKHFRFTFVTRMQNLSLDVIEKSININPRYSPFIMVRNIWDFVFHWVTLVKSFTIRHICPDRACLLPAAFLPAPARFSERPVFLCRGHSVLQSTLFLTEQFGIGGVELEQPGHVF